MGIQLRTQSDLATEHDAMLAGEDTAGTSNARWSVSQHYHALNYAIRQMAGKVSIPHLYTVSGGWVRGTYEYTLPDYMDESIEPQFKVPGLPSDIILPSGLSDERWEVFARWTIEPNANGGYTLRLPVNPRTADGRILWFASNGPVPTGSTLPTLNADMTASGTSFSIGSKPNTGKSGYVKIDSEWMFYAGVTEGTNSLTFNNLVRGLNGTTAATHDGSSNPATVTWGIAVTDPRQWDWLFFLCAAFLHLLPLNLAADVQRDYHEFQLRYFQKMANDYEAKMISKRSGRIRLHSSKVM